MEVLLHSLLGFPWPLLPQYQGLPFFFFFFFLRFYFRQREGREKERKRNINVWLPLTLPLLGTWPGLQPRYVPWLGIKLVTLWFAGRCLIQWATPARAWVFLKTLHRSLHFLWAFDSHLFPCFSQRALSVSWAGRNCASSHHLSFLCWFQISVCSLNGPATFAGPSPKGGLEWGW